MNLGNDGNGMRLNINDRKRGANPPKNVSGRTGTDSSVDLREKCVKTGNGSCSTGTNFSSTGPWIPKMWIPDVRSRYSSAAMRVFTPFSSTTGDWGDCSTMIGNGGQTSSNLALGVMLVQTSCRSRRRGDPKTTCRHRRHTCVSIFHLHVK